MRRVIVICSGLICAACQRVSDDRSRYPPPEAYIHLKDKVAAQLWHWGVLMPSPCSNIFRDDQCVKFNPPERIRGLWRNGFEDSVFCPEPVKGCEYESYDSRTPPQIWLDFAGPLPAQFRHKKGGGLYSVDFVGRRTKYKGSYGHMGMSDEEIIVDRMISMKEIEAPPKR